MQWHWHGHRSPGGAERNVLARSPGWPSRHEPDRSQGFPIPADNYSNELARVCDYVGKSPAWRSLDASVALLGGGAVADNVKARLPSGTYFSEVKRAKPSPLTQKFCQLSG